MSDYRRDYDVKVDGLDKLRTSASCARDAAIEMLERAYQMTSAAERRRWSAWSKAFSCSVWSPGNAVERECLLIRSSFRRSRDGRWIEVGP